MSDLFSDIHSIIQTSKHEHFLPSVAHLEATALVKDTARLQKAKEQAEKAKEQAEKAQSFQTADGLQHEAP